MQENIRTVTVDRDSGRPEYATDLESYEKLVSLTVTSECVEITDTRSDTLLGALVGACCDVKRASLRIKALAQIFPQHRLLLLQLGEEVSQGTLYTARPEIFTVAAGKQVVCIRVVVISTDHFD